MKKLKGYLITWICYYLGSLIWKFSIVFGAGYNLSNIFMCKSYNTQEKYNLNPEDNKVFKGPWKLPE